MELLYDANDNVLHANGLYTVDVLTGQHVWLDDGATVSVTLIDALTEDNVVGETWPLALNYIAGSRGDFIGVLRDGITVAPGQGLVARVIADNGTDQYGQIDVDVLVVSRRM